MRRFVTLAILLLFTIPFGISVSGCSKATAITYCNGQDSGVRVGQTVTLDLEPRLTGISLNQGQIGSIGAPTGKDCKGTTSSVSGTVYASNNRSLVDINPATGSGGLCAGTWNRNSGGGVADFTVCTPNGAEGTAFITASAQGVASNPIAVYVHPIVTSIVLGPASTNCVTDFASNCYATDTQVCYVPSPGQPTAPTPVGPPLTAGCLSQTSQTQLAARVFAGTGSSQENVSCLVGPLAFSAQTPSVVNIEANGLATAAQPGSTIINATISQSSSTAGSFSTCPPQSIVLSVAGTTGVPTTPVTIAENVTQELLATVTDTKGVVMNNVALTYVSTSPRTVPTSLNDITPVFPGSAAITAICQPPTCNPSAFDQIGLYGNGDPVFSNPVDINATGTNNSTVLYIASTESQYLLPIDFTAATQPSPVRLPYVPNSMVLSEDGTSIYLGTANELITFSTGSNSITRQDTTVSGTVLAISPNNSTVVVTDPVRKLTYLYGGTTGSVATEYGGIATAAEFTPDSSTVYIATEDGRLLAYSTFIGWRAITPPTTPTDLAITVPNAGVYLASNPVDVRSACPATTVNNPGSPNVTTTNVFYPDQGPAPVNAVHIAATNDGAHMLTANNNSFTDIGVTNTVLGAVNGQAQSGACPITFGSAPRAPLAFAQQIPVTAVLPTSDSAFAFITYGNTLPGGSAVAGGVIPQYAVATGALSSVALQSTSAGLPGAPITGVVSDDNQTFYVAATGDLLVHRLTRGSSGFSDTLTPINPMLPAFSGSGYALPNLLAQRPRRATS